WLLIPLAWAAIEYARTYLLTGFPWNLIAASIVDYTPLVQFDRVAGPYALGALMLLPSVLAAWLLMARPRGMARLLAVASEAIVCFVWWATGIVAAKMFVRPRGLPRARAAMLQPNISQEMRWNAANVIEIFRRMIAMTQDAVDGGAKVVIW